LIKLVGPPSGGLGNRLFHLNLLGQLAYLTEQEFVYESNKDLGIIEKAVKEPGVLRRALRRQNIDSAQLALALSTKKNQEIFAVKYKYRDVKLKPPMLGEYFFDSCFTDPKNIVKFVNASQIKQNYIAVHIRGGDFRSWNPKAILEYEYYTKAILHAENLLGSETQKILFTDDISNPNVRRIKENFNAETRFSNQTLEGDVIDFLDMANSEVLISSPSTFSIWAGILGKRKKVIHSKTWVDYRAKENDIFWINLQNGGNEYYSAELID
jgi:hypothetical protein